MLTVEVLVADDSLNSKRECLSPLRWKSAANCEYVRGAASAGGGRW